VKGILVIPGEGIQTFAREKLTLGHGRVDEEAEFLFFEGDASDEGVEPFEAGQSTKDD
jgi:hypothetical protein